MKWPSIYRYQGRWFFYYSFRGMSNTPWKDFIWYVFHGKWYFNWNWSELKFGIGNYWYDGPHYFLHAGFFSIGLDLEE